jgi:hypothetical protein
MDLPKYNPTHQVMAGKIRSFDVNKKGAWVLFLEGSTDPVEVSDHFFNKHRPEIGGYYAIHDNGYKACYSAEFFESQYTEIKEGV